MWLKMSIRVFRLTMSARQCHMNAEENFIIIYKRATFCMLIRPSIAIQNEPKFIDLAIGNSNIPVATNLGEAQIHKLRCQFSIG